MLVFVYTCQNATLLEITCHGSYIDGSHVIVSQRHCILYLTIDFV